jgi:RNA polymerase sigma-70 factor (ECF subfamily)
MSQGSQDRFVTAIQKSHGRNLRRFLAARMRNAAADVPDLMQEIFLRLLRIKDHEAIRNPQAYLYTIANHVLHQHALQRPGPPDDIDPLELASELGHSVPPDLADELDTRQRLEKVVRGLHQDSPRACATLLMYRGEGLTLTEIGERLGVSRTMAKKYLLHALSYCDQHLEAME